MSNLDWPTLLITAFSSLFVGLMLLYFEHRTKWFSERLKDGTSSSGKYYPLAKDWTTATKIALQNFKKQNQINWLTHDIKVEEAMFTSNGLRLVKIKVISKILDANNSPEERYEILINLGGDIHEIKKIETILSLPKPVSQTPKTIFWEDEDTPAHPDEPDFRDENLKRLLQDVGIVVFFGISYFSLAMSFYIPLFFFMGMNSTVDLNTIKIISWFSHAVVPVRGLGFWAFGLAIIFYIPILLLTHYLSLLLAKFIDQYIRVDNIVLYGIRFAILIFLFCVVAGLETYIISDLSLWCSCCLWPMIILLAIAAIVGGKSSSNSSK